MYRFGTLPLFIFGKSLEKEIRISLIPLSRLILMTICLSTFPKLLRAGRLKEKKEGHYGKIRQTKQIHQPGAAP